MPDEQETDAPETGEPETEAPASTAPDLGDAGKKALQAERARATKAEKDAKAAQAELAKLREANQSEQEKAITAAKAEGRQEVLAESNKRLIAAEVRAAAASRLQDPADALRLLDLDQFEVGEDGAVDGDAIAAAIAALVEAKPYLGATAGRPPVTGSAEGGARTPNQPQSLTEQIAAADAAGDVNLGLRLRTQLLSAVPAPNGG